VGVLVVDGVEEVVRLRHSRPRVNGAFIAIGSSHDSSIAMSEGIREVIFIFGPTRTKFYLCDAINKFGSRNCLTG
jgi:hypothetical protein